MNRTKRPPRVVEVEITMNPGKQGGDKSKTRSGKKRQKRLTEDLRKKIGRLLDGKNSC